MKYCESVYQTQRRPTRTVMVGNVGVGSDHPIRTQSMTTSPTRDVTATVDQVIRLADEGCDIVRITVQGMKEAESCEHIRNQLIQKGYSIPLVADIHFFPPAALFVADFVDKIRINPGNYIDKRATFKTITYTDSSYQDELKKIEEGFYPLVEKCKRLKRAIRIGTNHGSLSDRILNRYGDTPLGMVTSAFEFAEVCRKHDFHDMIFSMKSSNPQVMIQAYRLLTAKMYEKGWDYPLHLGVTEAGANEEGRIKSSMGIGALLLDGLGDTIRVSLTEDPWLEVDPCKRLVQLAHSYQGRGVSSFGETTRDLQSFGHRDWKCPEAAFHPQGSVFSCLASEDLIDPELLTKLGISKGSLSASDGVIFSPSFISDHQRETLQTLQKSVPVISSHFKEGMDLLSLKDSLSKASQISFQKKKDFALHIVDETEKEWEAIKSLQPTVIFLAPKEENRLHYSRHFFDWLKKQGILTPVVLNFSYGCSQQDCIIAASAEVGALLCDGLGEGLALQGAYPVEWLRELSLNLLQSARMRTTKTEFISCPSCGRTLFDLQEVSTRIRSKTAHLPGVKIAIMGCIVNGPGEMADADFGYVGSKTGKVDLYVGKEKVERNIDESEADEALIALIKSHGKWVDPVSTKENSEAGS